MDKAGRLDAYPAVGVNCKLFRCAAGEIVRTFDGAFVGCNLVLGFALA